mmetsp:Transcript_40046/g.83779  ORF Transcript_40046/g.83779 Transcript_40046/m.83779 type:complete len:229 (-) Transcript_40046:155-841(-)
MICKHASSWTFPRKLPMTVHHPSHRCSPAPQRTLRSQPSLPTLTRWTPAPSQRSPWARSAATSRYSSAALNPAHPDPESASESPIFCGLAGGVVVALRADAAPGGCLSQGRGRGGDCGGARAAGARRAGVPRRDGLPGEQLHHAPGGGAPGARAGGRRGVRGRGGVAAPRLEQHRRPRRNRHRAGPSDQRHPADPGPGGQRHRRQRRNGYIRGPGEQHGPAHPPPHRR